MEKRRSSAALQDAGAILEACRVSARFWSAPVLRRFSWWERVKRATEEDKAARRPKQRNEESI